MSTGIKNMQELLKENGYICADDLAKLVFLFERGAEKSTKEIQTLFLQGNAGAGKTSLGETFAKIKNVEPIIIQCFPNMGEENFYIDINPEGYIKQDSENVTKSGALLQAIEQSHEKPVVLIIDELDKSRPDVDSFLLDFLDNGRISTGTDIYRKGQYPIYAFITSNGKREIDENVLNRCRQVCVPRPEKELFLEILGVPEDHYIGWVYENCPEFSIRQAKKYLNDLDALGVEFDEDALSQYINIGELDIRTVADIERMSQISNIEFDIPNLDRLSIRIELDKDEWKEFITYIVNSNNPLEYIYEEKYNGMYLNIDTLEQLADAKKHIDISTSYRRWFEFEMSDSDALSGDIIWAGEKDKYGTRFGLKVIDDTIYKIAMNSGSTFVELNPQNELDLNLFLNRIVGQEEFETDSTYKTEAGMDIDV